MAMLAFPLLDKTLPSEILEHHHTPTEKYFITEEKYSQLIKHKISQLKQDNSNNGIFLPTPFYYPNSPTPKKSNKIKILFIIKLRYIYCFSI